MPMKFTARKAVREKIFVKMALMGSSGCVDADTEYFNGTHWRKISKYREGDKVLEYNASNGMASLCVPEQYHKYPCEKLWRITNNGTDQCLSDEHNVLFVNGHGFVDKMKFADIKAWHENSPVGFTGRFMTTFKYSGEGVNLSNDEIMFRVALLARGLKVADDKVIISLCNLNEKNHMISILKRLGYDFKIASSNESITSSIEVTFAADKTMTEFDTSWYNMTSEQLRIVADEVLMWKCNRTISRKSNANFIQFAFTACGYRATVERKSMIPGVRDYEFYKVTPNGDSLVGMSEVEVVPYETLDGFKYCFTTPTSNLVLRRNGKIFVTGNSGKTYSALRVASGMAEEIQRSTGEEARILVGNTENGRGRYYANEFNYDVVDLEAPFSPEMFVDFISFAVNEGYKILVIDSTSPEWEGKGGCLDLQMQAGGKYQDWGRLTCSLYQ